MKEIGIVGLLLGLLALVSCQHEQQVTDIQEIVPSDSIELEIGRQNNLFVYDDKLFVTDTKSMDGAIQVYDLNTNQFLFSFANEMDLYIDTNQVSHLDFYEVNGEERVDIYVFNRKIVTYNYEAILQEKYKAKPLMERNVHEKFPHFGLFSKTKNGYIITEAHPEGKFLLLSDSLELLKYAGNHRPKANESYGDVVHALANWGYISLSPDKRYLADCLTMAPIITLYELTENDMVKRWEYVEEELNYVPFDENNFMPNIKYGYVSASFSERYLYALYGDEPEDDEVGHYRKEVHVFDIQTGEMVKQYLLDRPSLEIVWHKGRLYVLTYEQSPVVQIYKLEE